MHEPCMHPLTLTAGSQHGLLNYGCSELIGACGGRLAVLRLSLVLVSCCASVQPGPEAGDAV